MAEPREQDQDADRENGIEAKVAQQQGSCLFVSQFAGFPAEQAFREFDQERQRPRANTMASR
jgi:hypothetical protein